MAGTWADCAGRSRHSTAQFRLERDMFSNLRESLQAALSLDTSHVAFIREPSIGPVIPDLLVAEYGEDLRLPRTNFTFVDARILALIEAHDELSPEEVLERLHLSPTAASRAFGRLRRSGLLIPTSEGRLSLDSGAFTRGLRITAIELKLSRWREALSQAHSYLRFADRAYVVLDGSRIVVTDEMIQAFRSATVGLMLLYAAEIRRILEPDSQMCVSPERVQAAQKICLHLKSEGIPSFEVAAMGSA